MSKINRIKKDVRTYFDLNYRVAPFCKMHLTAECIIFKV